MITEHCCNLNKLQRTKQTYDIQKFQYFSKIHTIKPSHFSKINSFACSRIQIQIINQGHWSTGLYILERDRNSKCLRSYLKHNMSVCVCVCVCKSMYIYIPEQESNHKDQDRDLSHSIHYQQSLVWQSKVLQALSSPLEPMTCQLLLLVQNTLNPEEQ